MSKIKTLGLALAAVFALSAGVSSAALASEAFVASKTGKLTGEALNTQKFKTKAGTVECTKLKVTEGEVTALETSMQAATIQYEGCKAFGLSATVSPAHFLFLALLTGGFWWVHTELTITIKATLCTVTVAIQENPGVEYVNKEGKIELKSKVTGITSKGEGAACSYAEEKEGTYEGNTLVSLEGGTIEHT